jgi:hypothetical protein
MANSNPLVLEQKTIGDRVVDGLLAGLGAGLTMIAYLVIVGLVMGEGPTVVLGRFNPAGSVSPLSGILLHLAVAGVYGALFGLLRRLLGRRWPRRLPTWLVGLVYGLALLFIAEGILLPGSNSPLQAVEPLHFTLAHVVYGLVLGWLAGRSTH